MRTEAMGRTEVRSMMGLQLENRMPERVATFQMRRRMFGKSSQTLMPQKWLQSLARRSEEHTSELQSPDHLVCRLLLEKKKKNSDVVQFEHLTRGGRRTC